MPAIQLARLKQQSALIATSFDRPLAFISGFHAVLNFYADRTFRPGQSGAPSTLLPAYNVPKPVLRQVAGELSPMIARDPARALALADALWQQDNLECKQLAVAILSYLPIEQKDAVIERARAWLPGEVEPRLVEAFFEQSLAKIHTGLPVEFEQIAAKWLESPRLEEQKLGLKALLTMVKDEDSQNLPFVFRKLTPLVRAAHHRLKSTLLEVLEESARRYPGEAAYFLKQVLLMPDSPSGAWLARQCLKSFPPETRASLREALRNSSKEL